MLDVKDIVLEYLKENGYDGLYNSDEECGCMADDLFLCEGCPAACLPGYDQGPRNGCDFFYIGPEKASKEEEDEA